LISRIPQEHADLARALAELVRIHRFDKLIAATDGALKENSKREFKWIIRKAETMEVEIKP